MKMVTRTLAAILPLLALSACLLTPGNFISSLDVRKDGSFTYAYKGEIIAEEFDQGLEALSTDAGATKDEASPIGTAADQDDDKKAKTAKLQAIAGALAKEKGFRSVSVADDNMLEIDYEITGTLDHSFVFPFNIDAEAIFPFVAIEVRNDRKIRIQAPGFGETNNKTGMTNRGSARHSGTFTLTTNASIVSQNQENGATETSEGKKILWQITPLTSIAPMAVLQLDESE